MNLRWTVLVSFFSGSIISLLAPGLSSFAQASFESARTEFERQNYEEALTLLDDAQRNAPDVRILRYLALSHYYLGDFQQAQNLLARVLDHQSEDPELLYALADTLLGLGQPTRALPLVQTLQKIAPTETTILLRGQILAALSRYSEASTAFAQALQSTESTLHQAAAIELVRYQLQEGRFYQANGTAQRAIAMDSESLEADILRSLQAHVQLPSKPSFDLHLSYRLEYDNNVPLEPKSSSVVDVSAREDSRQVFTADVLGRAGLGENFLLLGEAHLYQSWHEELDQFNQSNQNYLLSLGWSGGRWGLRIPAELFYNRLNHQDFLLSYETTPSLYLELGQGSLHTYGRYAENDFDENVIASEVRSGKEVGGGAWLTWPFARRRGRLRMILEHNRDATDGRNWQRNETQLYLLAEYSPLSRLTLELGYQRDNHQYRNVHDLFFRKRSDQGDTLFLSAAWQLTSQWDVRFQAIRTDWESNIPIYEYNREIYSFGINWALQ